MRISDWSSDVCSSDLLPGRGDELDLVEPDAAEGGAEVGHLRDVVEVGRDRVGQRVDERVEAVRPDQDVARDGLVDHRRPQRLLTYRNSVVKGKRVTVRVCFGCRRLLTKTQQIK